MSFILRLAWRDSRASRRRLMLYSTTIVLGIAALVAVGSFGANIRRTVGDQPRRLLGGDLRVGLSAWPNPEFQRTLDSLGATAAREKLFNSPLSGRGDDSPRRAVQVLALDERFPLYGDFPVDPAGALGRFRRGERVALIEPKVAEQFHVAPGDTITLTTGDYTVAGIVKEMPGEASVLFSIFGQIAVPWKTAVPDLPAGKRPNKGNYRIYLRLPPGTGEDAAAAAIKNRIPDAFPVVMTSGELGKNLDRALEQTNRFFALVVFVALFLGAVGVASALHIYIQERLARVALLRCLGASAGQAMAIYLCQAAALAACGALGGAVLGIAAQHGFPPLVQDFLPVRLEVFIAWGPVAAGMIAGFCVCMVFALLPLLAVRRAPPLAALRSEAAPSAARDSARAGAWILIAASVAGVAYWQARNWKLMLAYTAALGLAFGVFSGAAALLCAAARRGCPSAAPFVLRQGVANLHRPRNRTRLLLLSLGLGIFVVLTIYLVRSTLLGDFAGATSANLVVSNVPEDDLSRVLAEAGAEKIGLIHRIPSLKVSLESVNGKPPGAGFGRWRLPPQFSFAATRRDRLLSYETLVEGDFISRVRPGAAVIPVTVQAWMTRARGGVLRLGDEAVWNVAGVPMRTRIAGVRQISGLHLEPNFAVVFPQGAIDGAPVQDILFLRSPSAAGTSRFERALAEGSPKAQVFDLGMLIETIDRIFSKVAVVVDFIALFTIATGMVILAAAVVTGRHQRARESALLRSLGATRGQLRWVQLTEFGLVGLLACLLGCGLAAAANALIARFLLKIPLAGGALEIAIAAAAILSVTIATGVFADRGLANLSPLELLREET